MKTLIKISLTLIYSVAILMSCSSGSSDTASASTSTTSNTIDLSTAQQFATPSTSSCITVQYTPQSANQWWISSSFKLINSCSSAHSASGLQLLLGSNSQTLSANNFSLNNLSFPVWQPTTVSVVGVSSSTNKLLITLNTTGIIPANSSINGSFGYNSSGVMTSLDSLVINGSTPIVNATLVASINSANLVNTCSANAPCSIPIKLIGQGGQFESVIYTITQNNLGIATITVTGLVPGAYTIAPITLPANISESASPSSNVNLTSGLTSNVTLTFSPQQVNTGNIAFTLVNPNNTLFKESGLIATIAQKNSSNSIARFAGFNQAATVSGLTPESYIVSLPGLASASSGTYYAYASKTAVVKTNNATTNLGNITAVSNTSTITDTITVAGLDVGDSINFVFTDSINGSSYVFNAESLTSSSASPVVGTYKFINGDKITVNASVNGKYQAIAPFTITQDARTQNYSINLSKAAVVSSGTIYFHAFVPQTNISAFAQGDTMVLTGDNYTDLIMSNYISGVMFGRLIDETFPDLKQTYNKDYLYGTMFAQLLQENIQTQLYESSSNLLAPSYLQAAVMGVGQGGPYQINSYAYDMVGGQTTAVGYSMVNYIAIQAKIGYTVDQQPRQSISNTPASFNDKYYSPMLTAYFHLNDLRALESLENGSLGWVSSAAPNYPHCLAALAHMNNNPLEILVNYAYNQGYYGGLLNTMTTACVNNSASSFLSTYNSYANAGTSSSYNQYPYQVRFYLDEMYNQSTLQPQTNNHIAFAMPVLANVFANAFQTLAYVNGSGQYKYITADQANIAFNQALTSAGVNSNAVLDLSNTNQRLIIYSLLENAIVNLENNLGTNFAQTTLTQLQVQ